MRKSVLYVFLASVCFSTGGLFIKLIPWSPLAINGARNLIGAAVVGIFLLVTRHRIVFSRRVLTARRQTPSCCSSPRLCL